MQIASLCPPQVQLFPPFSSPIQVHFPINDTNKPITFTCSHWSHQVITVLYTKPVCWGGHLPWEASWSMAMIIVHAIVQLLVHPLNQTLSQINWIQVKSMLNLQHWLFKTGQINWKKKICIFTVYEKYKIVWICTIHSRGLVDGAKCLICPAVMLFEGNAIKSCGLKMRFSKLFCWLSLLVWFGNMIQHF